MLSTEESKLPILTSTSKRTTLKIKLAGWYGSKSALVEGELYNLVKYIESKLIEMKMDLDLSRKPHIEICTFKNPKYEEDYKSIDNIVIDPFKISIINVPSRGTAVTLYTGITKLGKHTHITLAFMKGETLLNLIDKKKLIKEFIKSFIEAIT